MMLENYLITGLPIPLKGTLGTLHQPTIKELMAVGYTNVDLGKPFAIHTGLLDKDVVSENDLMDFDLFFLSNEDQSLFNLLISSLSILYKTDLDNIQVIGRGIFIGDLVAITRDNYEELADTVLKMCSMERQEKEEEKTDFPSEMHRKIYMKMKEGRERQARKNQLHLCDIINTVCHVEGFIPYREVNNLTFYQLFNTYKSLLSIDSYREFVMYNVSTKFEIKKETEHWMKQLKISKSTLA